MFVIDTNVASELIRPEPAPSVAAWFGERDARDMYLTAVSEAELLYGVAIMPAGKRRNALQGAHDPMARSWLRRADPAVRQHRCPCLCGDRSRPPPRGPADRRGRLPISRSRGAALVTRNVRDFEGTGVQIINPFG